VRKNILPYLYSNTISVKQDKTTEELHSIFSATNRIIKPIKLKLKA